MGLRSLFIVFVRVGFVRGRDALALGVEGVLTCVVGRAAVTRGTIFTG